MPTLKSLPSITESAESEDLTLIEFEDGTSCYRTPEGGRKGKFPHSGIEFILRPRTLGDSQKLERVMGGLAEVQKFGTEAAVRMFCMCCESFGTTGKCSPSQLYELEEANDGMYLARVIESFRPSARS
jgi:hypothetical protein